MRLQYLEALRGYMALWVICIHSTWMGTFSFAQDSLMGRIILADTPVFVFIILSGFVSHILLDKKEKYKPYIIHRAYRLFPIYLVCLIISFLMLNFSLETLTNIPWEGGKNLERINLINITLDKYPITNLIAHIFLLHGLIPNSIMPASYGIMGQSWSLTLEWQYYLIVPFIYTVIASGKKYLKIILFFVVLLSILFSTLYMRQPSFIPNMIVYFAIGYFSYYLYKKENKSSLYIFIITLLLVATKVSIPFFSVCLIWLIVIYAQINKNRFSELIFNNKIMQHIGKISYSMYCVHMIILYIVSSSLVQYLHIDSRWLYGLLCVVLTVLLTTIISTFTYKWIEKPCMDFAKRKFK